MKLSTVEVYEMCNDFKELVKSKAYDSNLLELDLRLLSLRDCVLFYRNRLGKDGEVHKEEVRSVHRSKFAVRVSTFKEDRLIKYKDKTYPLKELSNFSYLLAPNKVVMSEIGKFYKNK